MCGFLPKTSAISIRSQPDCSEALDPHGRSKRLLAAAAGAARREIDFIELRRQRQGNYFNRSSSATEVNSDRGGDRKGFVIQDLCWRAENGMTLGIFQGCRRIHEQGKCGDFGGTADAGGQAECQ
jgi:hypothetical protein